MQAAFAKTATVRTTAIPLGKAAPGRGAEDFNAHEDTYSDAGDEGDTKYKEPDSESGLYKGVLDGLEFGVGVRADLAVQVDLFVLRGNPFHERRSLREINDRRQHSISGRTEEEGQNCSIYFMGHSDY